MPKSTPKAAGPRPPGLLGVGRGSAQAPTVIWESQRGGRLYLSGLPMATTAHRFPSVSLQVRCLPHGPGRRGGVTLPGAHLMTFAAAYASERSTQWAEVFPAIKNSLWAGDAVLLHCVKGRHRAAFAGVLCLCRALLEGETIDDANKFVEARQNTELRKVVQYKGMRTWLHKAWRETQVGSPQPQPVAYGATSNSSAHILTEGNVPLCRRKQSEGKSKRLVNPYVSPDVYEATAWSRPWCDLCLRKAPASWRPPA